MDKSKLGHKTQELRKAMGYSQRSLSAKSGVAYATIQAIEGGEGNPTIDTLEALSKTLGEPLVDVFTSQPPPAKPDRAAQERLLKNWFEASEVLNAIGRAKPLRRLVGLYILTRSDAYFEEIRAMLPPQSPVLQALRLIP
jgi:transcriptional regulator with XRE-family HTH domain